MWVCNGIYILKCVRVMGFGNLLKNNSIGVNYLGVYRLF